jgi:ABC-type dipeptide/oligopeptide/nickel transport system permease component
MWRFVARRLLQTVPVLLGTALLVFSMIHVAPGDPALLVVGVEAGPEAVQQVRRDLELDRPLPTQFVRFLVRTASGDLGVSIRTKTPVAREIAERGRYTVRLAVGAMLLAILLGMGAGIAAARRHPSLLDDVLTGLSLVMVSTPTFWLGLMLMLSFSLWLGWLPSIGVATPWHYVLPIVTLGLPSAGVIARLTRASVVEALGQPFILAARARGLSEGRIVYRHALRSALTPILSIIGLRFGLLLTGAVLVESVFAIPGLGRMIVDGVLFRDYPAVQGGVLVMAATFVLVNAVTDILYALADPRIRVQ